MKLTLPFLIFICILLTSCNLSSGLTSATETVSLSQTISPGDRSLDTPTLIPSAPIPPTSTSSQTPKPSYTPIASSSPTMTLFPTATQTFDVLRVPTRTPESPAQCPPENPTLVPSFDVPEGICFDIQTQVLDFLNTGGRLQRIVDEFKNSASQVDLTNDGAPELTIAECNFRVYSCKNGQYQTILDADSIEGVSRILAVEDMNFDGIPELIIGGWIWPYSNASTTYYKILEWDGRQFKNLVSHPDFESRYGGGGIRNGWIYSEGYAEPGNFMQSNMSL